MEPETGDVWWEMMTAADLALFAFVRKVRLLSSSILPVRDFRKTVLAGLLFQFLHTSVEWALFDNWLWLFLWLPLGSAVWRPFSSHIVCVVLKSDIESHG
jgi:hypothetical protein